MKNFFELNEQEMVINLMAYSIILEKDGIFLEKDNDTFARYRFVFIGSETQFKTQLEKLLLRFKLVKDNKYFPGSKSGDEFRDYGYYMVNKYNRKQTVYFDFLNKMVTINHGKK